MRQQRLISSFTVATVATYKLQRVDCWIAIGFKMPSLQTKALAKERDWVHIAVGHIYFSVSIDVEIGDGKIFGDEQPLDEERFWRLMSGDSPQYQELLDTRIPNSWRLQTWIQLRLGVRKGSNWWNVNRFLFFEKIEYLTDVYCSLLVGIFCPTVHGPVRPRSAVDPELPENNEIAGRGRNDHGHEWHRTQYAM